MNKYISRLKELNSYSQSWLQIIESNNYNEKAEENLNSTLNKLEKLYVLMSGITKADFVKIKAKTKEFDFDEPDPQLAVK
jgi:hypothetical protein